ncbi:hypothetical protein [Breoghania sp.]|uniref:hypothetical protein n=1 Tax=Breoghania sp. TaxID=2065378 RepID=UPI00262DC088|nr:hypothetical protein [Breoghania sp.]MDJ0932321.1 hypothetical protein [Breoghania sp.]
MHLRRGEDAAGDIGQKQDDERGDGARQQQPAQEGDAGGCDHEEIVGRGLVGDEEAGKGA